MKFAESKSNVSLVMPKAIRSRIEHGLFATLTIR